MKAVCKSIVANIMADGGNYHGKLVKLIQIQNLC